MFRVLGFCPLFLLLACGSGQTPASQWDGTYIGYYQQNSADTTLLTLTFEGKYYAAALAGKDRGKTSFGVFKEHPEGLFFQNGADSMPFMITGPCQYQRGADGVIRIWQDDGAGKKELIMRYK